MAVKPKPRSQGVQAKRLSLFPTPLAVSVLPECEALKPVLSALVLACYQEAAEAFGPTDSIAVAPWQGSFASTAEGGAALAALAQAAIVLADAMKAAPGGAWDVSWRAEVLHPGQGFEVQSLADGLWCACYLVDAGDGEGGGQEAGAALELQDPRGAATVMYAPELTFAAQGGETLGVSQTIGLKEGALLVFPAWLLQSTGLHQGKDARLSLSLLLRHRTPID